MSALKFFFIRNRFQLSSLSRPNFLLSYAVKGQDNAVVVIVSPASDPGLRFYVNNFRAKARHPLHAHTWYSSCITWDSQDGRYVVYLNGEMIKKGKNKVRYCASGIELSSYLRLWSTVNNF